MLLLVGKLPLLPAEPADHDGDHAGGGDAVDFGDPALHHQQHCGAYDPDKIADGDQLDCGGVGFWFAAQP